MSRHTAMVMMQQLDPSAEEAGAVMFCGLMIVVVVLAVGMAQIARDAK